MDIHLARALGDEAPSFIRIIAGMANAGDLPEARADLSYEIRPLMIVLIVTLLISTVAGAALEFVLRRLLCCK
jgi:hypothetical protein